MRIAIKCAPEPDTVRAKFHPTSLESSLKGALKIVGLLLRVTNWALNLVRYELVQN